LKDFLNDLGMEELQNIPLGIHSGIKNKKIKGIFFYYKYQSDFHFWYLYDIESRKIFSKNKSQIIDYITCSRQEGRIIPDFINLVYEVNREILNDVRTTYKQLEQSSTDSTLVQFGKERGTKFIKSLIEEIELQIDDYLEDFPGDKEVEEHWETIRTRLLVTPFTKKRISEFNKIWNKFKELSDWKLLIQDIEKFLINKEINEIPRMQPFNENELKLITIDFIS